MTPESALESNEDYSKSPFPGIRFLGRLVNLREQLTTKNADDMVQVNDARKPMVAMTIPHYAAIIDDLDDIIRSIQRAVHLAGGVPQLEPDSKPSDERSKSSVRCPDCDEPLFCGICASEPADSEDMEAR